MKRPGSLKLRPHTVCSDNEFVVCNDQRMIALVPSGISQTNLSFIGEKSHPFAN